MDNKRENVDSEIHSIPQPSQNVTKPTYQFTSEELRVLRDCNKESFFQRSLPLSALFSGGIYYGVKSGFLQGHPKYGATPKIIAAVVIGYFAGKFSYQRKCAEKLMMLPNSPIGEMLRQRRKGHLQETLEPGYGPGMSLSPFSTVTDSYSDIKSNVNSIDLDMTRPEIGGLDDTYRPSLDNPILEEDMPPVQKSTTTYEELRKQNRDEFQQKRVGNYRQTESFPHPAAPTQSVPNSSRTHTNKYGDAME
ncbi:hypothetical protein RN001_015377 [Aquatica leii]|uniref:OCIA domain-containing protein n=1 Tax=Aquatica leii TaxID=1421715 RepID=A0AAN7QCJ6_9COLE|nr:hypothetical protein RN001_015377 [Aquatica leii]